MTSTRFATGYVIKIINTFDFKRNIFPAFDRC